MDTPEASAVEHPADGQVNADGKSKPMAMKKVKKAPKAKKEKATKAPKAKKAKATKAPKTKKAKATKAPKAKKEKAMKTKTAMVMFGKKKSKPESKDEVEATLGEEEPEKGSKRTASGKSKAKSKTTAKGKAIAGKAGGTKKIWAERQSVLDLKAFLKDEEQSGVEECTADIAVKKRPAAATTVIPAGTA